MSSFVSQLIREASQARVKLDKIHDVLADEPGKGLSDVNNGA